MMASVIVAVLVKATLILLAAFGMTALLRRASAAARHAIWSAALVGVIAVPALTMVLPWRMELLPSGWGSSRPGAATIASATELADTPMPTPTPTSWNADFAPDGGAVGSGTTFSSRGSIDPLPDSGIPGFFRGLARDPWRLALFAWLGVAALILLRIFVGMAWMWRLARRAQPLSGPQWLLPLGRVMERLELRTAVRVVRSGAAAMPVTCGVLRPAVVLPEESDGWTEERREAVLLHELAHVHRADLATHLIAWVACALYWFHPLAWIAARRLRHESERACDDLVLGAGTRASEYAAHLLDIVRSAGRNSAPAAAVPMAQRSSFEGRLLAILEPGVARHAMTARRKAALVAGLAFVVLPLAAMAPAQMRLDPAIAEEGWEATDVPAGGIALDAFDESKKKIETADPEALAEGVEVGLGDGLVAVDALVPSENQSSASTSRSSSESSSQSQSQGQPKTREQIQAEGRMIAALSAALDDPDAAVRMSSAQALGSLSDPRAVEALLEALRTDPDAGVRKMAAWALGEIESPTAVGGLSQAARSDASVDVRAMAVWALGEIESPEAVPALGAALRDSGVEVRRMAVWALGEIESAEAVEWLAPALRDEDVEIRRKAAWALGEIESAAAVSALGGALRDSDAEVRATAAWALGEIQSPSGVDPLRTVIRDSDVEVRRKAVWALGEIQDARGVAPLTEALSDSDKETRKTAVWALGEIQDPSAIPALRPLLDDPDAEIRETAIWALLEMDDASVYDVLVQLLKDEDPEVRRKAAEALGDR